MFVFSRLTRHGRSAVLRKDETDLAHPARLEFSTSGKGKAGRLEAKTWPTLPQKMQVDSDIYQRTDPVPSTMCGQAGERLLFFFPSFLLPIHPTQCEALGRIARSLAAGRKSLERY